jgi:heptosyltransferase III
MAMAATRRKDHTRGVREGSIRRVVVVFPGALGDLLLALPALRLLRRRHAGAHVTLVVPGFLRSFAAALDVADHVADLDDAASARLFAGDEPPPWLLDRPVVYSWLGATDPAVRARLAAWTTDATVLRVERGADGPHAMVAYARMLGCDDPLEVLAADGAVVPPRSSRADAACGRRPLLAMHRGAGAQAKRWPASGFAAVAAWWRTRGGDVIDVVGPADVDLAPLDAALVVCAWPLLDVAALLSRVDAWIGNDSGVGHLAGAVGARGVGVFVTTPARRWRPATGRIAAIESPSATDGEVDRVIRALREAVEP